jgi:hydroxymethylpyrimidine pyrophosphatase-like HAD family hydrolase
MSAAPRGPLVLATDLDGTLAHGDAAVRDRLVRLLRADARATLIYVTGRTPAAARELARRTPLPPPDLLIADVGTSVLRGLGPERVVEIEAELDRLWPGESAVRARLAPLAADLAPQEVAAPRRVSYWIEPVRRAASASAVGSGGDGGGNDDGDPFAARPADDPSLAPAAAALAGAVARRAADRLRELEVDVVVSANVFLDVLPRGVNKGTTLRRVLRWLGAADDCCVVAGDSLNDLALFETGLAGVAVGNCEPALRRRVAGLPRVYQARAEGVAGLFEGLCHHGYMTGEERAEGDHGE